MKDFFGNFHIFSTSSFFWGKMNHFSLIEMVVSTKSGEDFTFYFFLHVFLHGFSVRSVEVEFCVALRHGNTLQETNPKNPDPSLE